MARTRTLSQLRDDVRKHADLEGADSVTDDEVDEYINQGIAELYDMLVQARGQESYATRTTLTLAASTELIDLPYDCYVVLRLTTSINGATYALAPYEWDDRESLQPQDSWRDYPTGYRLQGGSQLSVLPLSNTARSLTLYYLPAPARLTYDGDTFDGVAGWEEYAVWRATADCLAKEERDMSFAMAKMNGLEKRIKGLAAHRVQPAVQRIRDVSEGSQTSARTPWRRLPLP